MKKRMRHDLLPLFKCTKSHLCVTIKWTYFWLIWFEFLHKSFKMLILYHIVSIVLIQSQVVCFTKLVFSLWVSCCNYPLLQLITMDWNFQRVFSVTQRARNTILKITILLFNFFSIPNKFFLRLYIMNSWF